MDVFNAVCRPTSEANDATVKGFNRAPIYDQACRVAMYE